MAPDDSSVAPNTGSSAGGTSVTVTGAGLSGATILRFGATPAAGLVVVSSTQITGISPPGTGTVNVVVTGPTGTSSQTVPFTYVNAPAPIVSTLTPNSGPVAGGTTTITGSGFTGTTQVRFGSLTSSFTVNSGTQITASIPAAAGPGPVLVTVTTTAGTSNPAPFCYSTSGAPFVADVSPGQGPLAGGNAVTITGTGFTAATQVRFGSLTSAFTVNSDNQVSATVPAGSGTVPVTVTTPGGTSTGNAPYSYLPAPAITSLHPSEGTPSGGDSVTITGTGFTYATDVRFGTSPGLFSIVSDTQIVARAPAGAGTVIVTVTSPGGFSSPGAPYVYL
jgi:hypothetical protein